MRHIFIIVSILALLGLPAKGQDAHDLMIVNVTAPAALVPTATSGIVYFAIMNHGPTADALVSVSTTRAKSATLHESFLEGDIAKMRDLERIDVPPGGFVELKQGGRHVMLTGLAAPLKQGEEVQLELMFEKAGKLQLKVKIGAPAIGHDHSSGD
jgi:periplasmic copper chaperone A